MTLYNVHICNRIVLKFSGVQMYPVHRLHMTKHSVNTSRTTLTIYYSQACTLQGAVT